MNHFGNEPFASDFGVVVVVVVDGRWTLDAIDAAFGREGKRSESTIGRRHNYQQRRQQKLENHRGRN